jgi:putative ABC transport system ATP-binding protein
MSIALHNVVPHPLRMFLTDHHSEVWNTQATFNKGERVFVSAPSGKGKTTLLMILYGVRKDYDGEVVCGEQAIRSRNHTRWTSVRRDSISVLFQELRLFPEMTGLENVALKNAITGYADELKLKEYAVRLDVAECLYRPCRQLSLGQQQRIALIRSLMQPFEWLLLDEPFSHLDADNAAAMAALIDEECESREAGLIVAGFTPFAGLKCGRELGL